MTALTPRQTSATEPRGRSATDLSRDSYYGVPPVHRPHWHWLIVTYFFTGGLAGGSYVVASLSDVLGGEIGRRIARVARYVSFAALLPSPVLLILDLKRPDRFLHMLRVVKLRSPMSLGVWGLVSFSAFATLSALIQAAEDEVIEWLPVAPRMLRALPARLVGGLGIPPAFFLSGYTGVLLAATAVPLWTRAYRLLGPLFLASAVSTGTAAVALAVATLTDAGHTALRRLERLDSLSLVVELVLLLRLPASLTPTSAGPLVEGRLGLVHNLVLTLGLAAPLGVQAPTALFGWRLPRALSVATSALVLAGGFLLRYLVVTAGKASADDPAATFELTDGR